jgi:hypothetical protein
MNILLIRCEIFNVIRVNESYYCYCYHNFVLNQAFVLIDDHIKKILFFMKTQVLNILKKIHFHHSFKRLNKKAIRQNRVSIV